jgi:uncharacterized Zn-finger protein
MASSPISSIQNPEVIVVKTKRVSCNGGGGALGHPKVYYDLGEANEVECLYCDRRFVYQHDPNADDHH